MSEIEKSNPGLKGVLPKDYNRPALDKVMLGELIDLVFGIGMGEPSMFYDVQNSSQLLAVFNKIG